MSDGRTEPHAGALSIDLLGPPRAARPGVGPVQPRGRKCWGLLAYLLLADRPPTRSRLADLLFPDADDPLGALRWSLSELRRALGPVFRAHGDPVVVTLPPTGTVDLTVLQHGHWSQAVGLPGLGKDLIEGVTVSGSAAFEIWLATERTRLAGAAGAVLHTATTACLAAHDAATALGHASALVALQPFDEGHHVLLVHCLRASGDDRGAVAQARRSAQLLRRELGHDPGPVLRDAARAPVGTVPAPWVRSVPAMLEAAEAAISAGAVPQGLQTLADATVLARQEPDRLLLARVLLARGRALVHLGRCGDEEGAVLLHEAAAAASEVDPAVAAAAHRELAYAELQRGRYDRVRAVVASARALAAGDDEELSWIESLQGARHSDQGRHAPALEVLSTAVDRADASGARDASIFARSFLGRLHVLRGEVDEAEAVLGPAAQEARDRWIALLPFLEALLAETELMTGAIPAAERRLERAFVMGRQLDDACLESITTRGLGLAAVAAGDVGRGYELLVSAPRLSRRLPDSYLWIEAYGLDALCRVAVEHRPAQAPGWVAQLERLAARCGMRELLAWSLLHRSRLGDADAFAAARELARDVDSPVLHAELGALPGADAPPHTPAHTDAAQSGRYHGPTHTREQLP